MIHISEKDNKESPTLPTILYMYADTSIGAGTR